MGRRCLFITSTNPDSQPKTLPSSLFHSDLFSNLYILNHHPTDESTSHPPQTMSRTKVLLVGASGETGGSIVNGLLESGNFVRAVPGVGTGGVFGTNIFFF